MGKGHDGAKHPTTHGAALTTKNYPPQMSIDWTWENTALDQKD